MEAIALREETSPYRIPDDGVFRVLNVSGGRSSGFLLYEVLKAHDGKLPPRTIAAFTNTGLEREETYEFLDRMSRYWSVPILWLEYRYNRDAAGGSKDPKNQVHVVNFKTASRKGEPFESLIRGKRMLPNVVTRMCTSELKVKTLRRYLWRTYRINRKQYISVLGIRYDEPRRWVKKYTAAHKLRNKTMGQFSKRWDYHLLTQIAETVNPLPIDLADDEEGISCFCGD